MVALEASLVSKQQINEFVYNILNLTICMLIYSLG
jgi:hypothetical protein